MGIAEISRELTPKMILVGLSASLAALNAGYEGGYFSTILVNQFFLGEYGHYDVVAGARVLESDYQSAGAGLGAAGTMLGALFFTPVAERFGRKWAIFASAVVSIVGALMQCLSFGQIWAFIIGKAINNMGTGIANAIVPVYLAECSPGVIRGTVTSMYQWFYTLGQLIAYLICFLTADIDSKWSYMIVVICSMSPCVVLLGTSVFLPESPRWLLQQGRLEQARVSFNKIFSKSDATEFEMMMQEMGQKENHNVSYLDLFKKKNFRRTMLVIAVPCLLVGQGLSFMASYLVLFLVQIGVANSLMMLVVIMAVLLVTNSFSFYGTDRFGRRPILMTSSLVMGCSFFIVAGVGYYGDGSYSSQQVCLAFLFIWCISYGCSWAPLAHITAGELPSADLREKSLSLATFLTFGISMMISFVNPFMQNPGYGNLQSRVGFVYGSISFFSFVYVYFLLPEVKELPLNVIDTLFDEKVATKDFQREGRRLVNEILEHEDDPQEIHSILSSKEKDVAVNVNEKENSI